MGIFGILPSWLSGTFCEPDDDPGNFHLGESVNVVDELPTDNSGKETFRLFEIAAENARVSKCREPRSRYTFADILYHTFAFPAVIEGAKIDGRTSASRGQWLRLNPLVAGIAIKLEEIAGRITEVDKRGIAPPVRIVGHRVTIQPMLHQLQVRTAEIECVVRILVIGASPTFRLFGKPDDDILDPELHKPPDLVDQLSTHHVSIENFRLFEIAAGKAYVTHTGKSRLS